jgi:4-diphosphocytidyl-2-C-methyl-D-erythritol kinase
LLDSLVVFAGMGDAVSACSGEILSLAIEGAEGAALAAEPDNLVLRAARALAAEAGLEGQALLHLLKRLPIASGIGGGSADAAAALRVLNRLWGIGWPEARLAALGAKLGADVPVCVGCRPARMEGVGEVLGAAPSLPRFGLLLANPRAALATPAVFRARQGGFSPRACLPQAWGSVSAMVADLARLQNDLEAPAISLCPAIADVLAAISASPGCLLARMSGSGATCFGVFPNAAAAAAAAAALPPAWWCWGGGLHGATL